MISVQMRWFKVWLPLFSKIFPETTWIKKKKVNKGVWSCLIKQLLKKEEQCNEKLNFGNCKPYQWQMCQMEQSNRTFFRIKKFASLAFQELVNPTLQKKFLLFRIHFFLVFPKHFPENVGKKFLKRPWRPSHKVFCKYFQKY